MATGDADHLLQGLLEEASQSTHHGKPGLSAARKRWWARQMVEDVSPETVGQKVSAWADHPAPVVRQVALVLMSRIPNGRALIEPAALHLASDADWEVREWVVEPLAHWVEEDPAWGEPLLLRWLDLGGGPRRAAVVAVRALVLRHRVSCAVAVAVADRVIDDDDPSVRASTGSYLLGDGLYRTCPDLTLTWLAQRVSSGRLTPAFLANLLALTKARDGRAGSERLIPIVQGALTHMSRGSGPGLARWLENVTGAPSTRDNQER